MKSAANENKRKRKHQNAGLYLNFSNRALLKPLFLQTR
jgi:hypothetical protein